jgi:uncharacterized protein (DUF1501 family)
VRWSACSSTAAGTRSTSSCRAARPNTPNTAAIRQDLALAQGSLLPITPLNLILAAAGASMPACRKSRPCLRPANAAFVANVGTLVQPVTKAEYDNGQQPPAGLFSHSDQTEQWQSSLPNTRSAVGWAGRMADLLKQLNSIDKVSMNISLSGTNVWQSGQTIFEYAITEDGAVGPNGYNFNYQPYQEVIQPRSAAVDSQLGLHYSNLFAQAFAKSEERRLRRLRALRGRDGGRAAGQSHLPGHMLGQQLQMVAKAIAGRNALGATRQTYFINFGGWDHHDEVHGQPGGDAAVVSQAIGAFYNALTLMGLQDQVTLFTASDFGRTLTSNGRGSDHAWGGNQLVVGGASMGARSLANTRCSTRTTRSTSAAGRLIPTTSVDAFFAEMALWLGVSKASLPLVLPNITRFYNLASASNPVGFLP